MDHIQHMEKSTNINDIDIVTGLYGNHTYRAEIAHITTRKESYGIMIFGIDNFKHINDLYSYSFGDRVLKQFVDAIKAILNPNISLFRLDGDGFGLLYFGTEVDALEIQYKKILIIAQTPKKLDGLTVSFSISAGICKYPENGNTCDILYQNVRLALAEAKTGTKKRCVYYSPELSKQAKLDMQLSGKLKSSVENNFEGFYLVFQPILKAETKEIDGCEALLRWSSASFPVEISPYVFIPVLENNGLILEVGNWVFEEALKQCRKWHKIMPDFKININVSAKQFDEDGFLSFIVNTISKYNINPEKITLELTETSRVGVDATYNAFEFLRKQGIKTAFDDFGTGYSSLDMFRSIRTDALKIDRSFLERITHNITDHILLKSIIDMCRSMNIIVCVEGIENAEIENIVSQMEPHLLQGYLYSRPISAEKFETKYLTTYIASIKNEKLHSSMVYSELRLASPMTFAEIINNAYAGIFQVGLDKEFSFLTCNEGYRRMLGYTMREMEEKFANKALGFVHPDDTEWVNNEIRKQLGEGDTVTIEFRVVRSDGRPIWILGTGNVVQRTGSNPSLIIVIIENDKRIRKNLSILAEYDMQKKILTHLPAGITYLYDDADFAIDYMSPAFLSALGFTEKELLEEFDGKYVNLIYEDDRQQVFNAVLEQKKTSDVINLRYRSYCKGGRIVWVETLSRYCPPDSDGIRRWCSSILDITESITDEQKTSPFNVAHRYQSAAQYWGDVIFEYNFHTCKATFSKSIEAVFGYKLPENNILEFDIIYKEDLKILHEMIEQAKLGNQPEAIELRVVKNDGNIVWCRVFVNTSELLGDRAVSVIGKITNIDDEHTERKLLELKSQTDSLTGLLNKGSLEHHITDIISISPNSTYALWMLDVDGFKQINDTQGHFIGDEVIKIIAKRLRRYFRMTDIVGRAGGDEFLLFMKYRQGRESLIKKGEDFLKSIKLPIAIGENIVLNISLSIGIACYPDNGTTFSELFQKADGLLYRVKKSGKNNFLIAD